MGKWPFLSTTYLSLMGSTPKRSRNAVCCVAALEWRHTNAQAAGWCEGHPVAVKGAQCRCGVCASLHAPAIKLHVVYAAAGVRGGDRADARTTCTCTWQSTSRGMAAPGSCRGWGDVLDGSRCVAYNVRTRIPCSAAGLTGFVPRRTLPPLRWAVVLHAHTSCRFRNSAAAWHCVHTHTSTHLACCAFYLLCAMRPVLLTPPTPNRCQRRQHRRRR